MTTRQEQFEIDRRNMLVSIGEEVVEPIVYPEDEVEESQNSKDFGDKLQRLKAEGFHPDDFEYHAGEAFIDHSEFEKTTWDMDEKEEKKARTMRHNKYQRAKDRLNKLGPADAFGWFAGWIDKYQATSGGGILFWIFVVFYILPTTIAVGNGTVAKVVYSLAWVGIIRFGGNFLAYLARGAMEMIFASGPKFYVVIREGSPALKTTIMIVNSLLWFASHAFIVSFVLVVIMVTMECKYTSQNWLTYYLVTMGLALVSSIFSWFFFIVIGYFIYIWTVSRILSNHKNAKYVLKYLYDSNRVMITTRSSNKPFVSKEKRLEAFVRDCAGWV